MLGLGLGIMHNSEFLHLGMKFTKRERTYMCVLAMLAKNLTLLSEDSYEVSRDFLM